MVLQGGQLASDASVAAVFDRGEIVGVPFGEEGFAGAQGRVMDAQMFLENLPAAVDRFEAREGLWAATIIASQVRRGLFAFKDGGVTDLAIFQRAVGRDIGAVTALREGNFEGGDRVAVFLCPKEGEAF